MNVTQLKSQLFLASPDNFEHIALCLCKWQYENIKVYQRYVDLIGVDIYSITQIEQIPFLPIQFFKTHPIISSLPKEESVIFESSGTTLAIKSKHYIQDLSLYTQSYRTCFQQFFGDVTEYCILGLLPSYLERNNSSLVYMVNDLITASGHPESGFYLHDFDLLQQTLHLLEAKKQKTILFGVTFGLLDFAEFHAMPLSYVKIMETGGMKGRREEWTKQEVHAYLQERFSTPDIYSEYGMTELLSQAYSLHDGIFSTPPWMKILCRDINDPFDIRQTARGAINIIDFANIYSCCFIATDDIGEIYEDQSFSIHGRIDNSELRGCSLMLA